MSESTGKVCFFITPIGEDGSEDRRRSDDVLDYIVTPSVGNCGYILPVERADKMSNPGRITDQIIRMLLTTDLVIADLSGHNPNVFYELAIRHAIRKPVVQISHKDFRLPFDVATQRTIFYDHHDLRSVHQAKIAIEAQIQAVEKDPTNVDTPLTGVILELSLEQSGNEQERADAAILRTLGQMQSQINELQASLSRGNSSVNREITRDPLAKGSILLTQPRTSWRLRRDIGEQTKLETETKPLEINDDA